MAYQPEIKEQMDMRLLPWLGVTSREMFGSVCYLYQDLMFAFISGESLMTKLPSDQKKEAMEHHGATEFLMSEGRPFGQWIQFPLADPSRVDTVMSWVEKGYSYVKILSSAKRKNGRRSRPKDKEPLPD